MESMIIADMGFTGAVGKVKAKEAIQKTESVFIPCEMPVWLRKNTRGESEYRRKMARLLYCGTIHKNGQYTLPIDEWSTIEFIKYVRGCRRTLAYKPANKILRERIVKNPGDPILVAYQTRKLSQNRSGKGDATKVRTLRGSQSHIQTAAIRLRDNNEGWDSLQESYLIALRNGFFGHCLNDHYKFQKFMESPFSYRSLAAGRYSVMKESRKFFKRVFSSVGFKNRFLSNLSDSWNPIDFYWIILNYLESIIEKSNDKNLRKMALIFRARLKIKESDDGKKVLTFVPWEVISKATQIPIRTLNHYFTRFLQLLESEMGRVLSYYDSMRAHYRHADLTAIPVESGLIVTESNPRERNPRESILRGSDYRLVCYRHPYRNTSHGTYPDSHCPFPRTWAPMDEKKQWATLCLLRHFGKKKSKFSKVKLYSELYYKAKTIIIQESRGWDKPKYPISEMKVWDGTKTEQKPEQASNQKTGGFGLPDGPSTSWGLRNILNGKGLIHSGMISE